MSDLPGEFFDAVRPTFGGALKQTQVDGLNFLVPEMIRRRVERPQAAYILATAFWETARSMEPVEEGFYLGPERAARHQKTLRYYPFYGRGYVQLTWDYNYRTQGDRVGVDLVSNPERALEPEIARDVLIDGMMTGAFTGKALPEYVSGNRMDFVNARRVVNGKDKASTIAIIAADFNDALALVDFTLFDPTPPPPENENLARLRKLTASIRMMSEEAELIAKDL